MFWIGIACGLGYGMLFPEPFMKLKGWVSGVVKKLWGNV